MSTRRPLAAAVLGLVSVACASGAFEPTGAPPDRLEPLALADHSVIRGIVSDARTGKTLAGALVVIQCTCLSGQREATTDSVGVYVFRGLPPGEYTVQVLYGQANVRRASGVPLGFAWRADFRVSPNNVFS